MEVIWVEFPTNEQEVRGEPVALRVTSYFQLRPRVRKFTMVPMVMAHISCKYIRQSHATSFTTPPASFIFAL